MNQKATFQITISGTEDGEWQGSAQMPDGKVLSFRSVLELLEEIHSQIGPAEDKKL